MGDGLLEVEGESIVASGWDDHAVKAQWRIGSKPWIALDTPAAQSSLRGSRDAHICGTRLGHAAGHYPRWVGIEFLAGESDAALSF